MACPHIQSSLLVYKLKSSAILTFSKQRPCSSDLRYFQSEWFKVILCSAISALTSDSFSLWDEFQQDCPLVSYLPIIYRQQCCGFYSILRVWDSGQCSYSVPHLLFLISFLIVENCTKVILSIWLSEQMFIFVSLCISFSLGYGKEWRGHPALKNKVFNNSYLCRFNKEARGRICVLFFCDNKRISTIGRPLVYFLKHLVFWSR